MAAGIYRIVNKVNGKFYIGKSLNIDGRWYLHKWSLKRQRKKNRHLQAAWNKYGAENFQLEVLELVPDLGLLTVREQWYLDNTRCLDPRYGYNKNPRSDDISEEMRRRISEGNKGRPRSAETRAKLSRAAKGRPWSESLRQKLKGRGVGLRNAKARPIFQYTMEGAFVRRWDYIAEAAKALGISKNNICTCAVGRMTSVGGYIWRYEMAEVEAFVPAFKAGAENPAHRPVAQYDLDGRLVRRWGCAMEAAAAVGRSPSAISACANGRGRTSAGYVWRYEAAWQRSRNVEQYDKAGTLVGSWPSAAAAAAGVGCRTSNISRCARGLRGTAAGYVWRYSRR